jgi:hypothetical protein
MERRTLVILLVAAVVVSAAAAWFTLAGLPFGRGARDDGRPQTVERALPAFQAIRIRGIADVTQVQGATPAIRMEGAGDLPAAARVEGGTLVISTSEGRRDWHRWLLDRTPRTRPRVTVTFTDLSRIEISGNVDAHAASLRMPKLAIEMSGAGSLDLRGVDVDELHVEGSGAVKANLAGRATRQHVEISGAGEYTAADLASERAQVDVSGAGNVVVDASKSLDVSISGAGQVSYLGDPALTKSISGLGRVRQVEGKREIRADERRAPAPRPSLHVPLRAA